MRCVFFHFAVVFSLLLGWNSLCLAKTDTFRSKLGVEIKSIRTNVDANVGWLAGIKGGRYLGKSDVYWGLVGFYGVPRGTNPQNDYMVYGGLSLGYDGAFSRLIRYEGSINVGYGEGRLSSLMPVVHEKSYYVIEPSFATGYHLGNGWRILFTTSYLYMNEANSFSGITFGVRLDFKSQTSVKAID